MGNYIVGITGASGSIYGKRVVEQLLELGHEVHLCVTEAGKVVVKSELQWEVPFSSSDEREAGEAREAGKAGIERLHWHDINSIGASIASGSFNTDGMIVVPCSMGTLSAICHGASDNLLERAADVCLKERRRLVIVPREAPYNQIHLENMLQLSKYGATIMPASPGFYANPETLDDLINFFVLRLLDQLGIKKESGKRWCGVDDVIA